AIRHEDAVSGWDRAAPGCGESIAREACHHPVTGGASDRQAAGKCGMHVAWSRIRLTLHALLERGGRGRRQRTQHTHRRAGYSAPLSFVPVASALADPIIRNPAILGACQADVVEGGVLRYTQCGVHASGKQWTLTVECNQR